MNTFPSQIPLCLAPNGRCLPEMGKSHRDSNKFSIVLPVTEIPCWEDESGRRAPERPTQPDVGGNIRIMSVHVFKQKMHAGTARNFKSIFMPFGCGKECAETAGIMKRTPDIPRFGGAFGCAGLLLTPVIQDCENKPGMEAG